jgi:nitroimidazol reductase NimA-like FMN-containing flavoprotein (pyridoxamine 5'-phosphate oxidase superfamily)
MRRKEKEMQDRSEMEEFIKQTKICRLALVDKDKPYIIPMSFGFDWPHLYFHSALEGRKIDIIKLNPNVCFEFDELIKINKEKEACDWGMDFKSVIGEGKAVLVEDFKEKTHALDVIMAQYSSRGFTFPRETMEKTGVIKVTITQMTGKKSN